MLGKTTNLSVKNQDSAECEHILNGAKTRTRRQHHYSETTGNNLCGLSEEYTMSPKPKPPKNPSSLKILNPKPRNPFNRSKP